ncbi:MAG: AAA family ATPase, partial [Crenarchaeota archaeon]|nr:AAA family ATPase [Thermoproteota archaeon]
MPLLTLELENFGPIIRGRIPLNRLTILIGPNSSGKTYVTELIYIIIKTFRKIRKTRYLLLDNNIISKLNPLVQLVKNKITEQINKNVKNIEISISSQEFLEKLEEFISSEFSKNFIKILERTYKTKPEKLVTADHEQSNIKISHPNVELNININKRTSTLNVNTKIVKFPEIKIQINPIKENYEIAFQQKVNNKILISIYTSIDNITSRTTDILLLRSLMKLLRNFLEDPIRVLGD